MNKLITLLLFLAAISPAAAIVPPNTEDTGTGNDALWIVLTVIFTIVFLYRHIVLALLSNPAITLVLIVALFVIYILVKAFMIVIGIGETIDGAVDSTANVISNILR